MLSGVYIGEDVSLKGETALLQVKDSDTYLAQFDHHSTGMGYGWWEFPKTDFKLKVSPFVKLTYKKKHLN